jgi:hypothetical protein
MLEAGLLAYAGFASLAIARKRHRPTRPLPVMPAPAQARLIGVALLALSFAVALFRFGVAQGPVAWTGQLCVAGVAFVLLLSLHHRMAIAIGMILPFSALIILLS